MEKYKKSRGWRNNNPLNIRRGEAWIGLSSTPRDTEFCSFLTRGFGYRAAAKVLKSYFRTLTQHKKPFTVENIIKRWAPENENNTEAYIRRVEELLYGNPSLPSPLPRVEEGAKAQEMFSSPRGKATGRRALLGNGWEGVLGRPDTPQGARHIAQLMAAMTCVECGCPPSAVPYTDIQEGVQMAYGIQPRLDDIRL